MSNGYAGAYGLVPAALRESGRIMGGVLGDVAESRKEKAQQGLEMTKLQYGLGKDIRAERQRREQLEYERGMDAPTTPGGALDFFVSKGMMKPEQRDIMLKSEVFGLLKNETTMGGGRPVTARSIITIMDTLRKEQKAETETETKRTQELADASIKREHEIKVAQVKADAALEKQLAKEQRAKEGAAGTQKQKNWEKEFARKSETERRKIIKDGITAYNTLDEYDRPDRKEFLDDYVKTVMEKEKPPVDENKTVEIQRLAAMYQDLKKNNPDATAEELKAMLAGEGQKPTEKPGRTLTPAEQGKLSGIKGGLAEGRLEGIKEGWREKSRAQRQGKKRQQQAVKRKEELKKRIASLQKTIERYPASSRTARRQESLARLRQELEDLET